MSMAKDSSLTSKKKSATSALDSDSPVWSVNVSVTKDLSLPFKKKSVTSVLTNPKKIYAEGLNVTIQEDAGPERAHFNSK